MRQKLKENILKSTLVATIIFLFSKPAFAYIDPGTMSIVVQAIVAGIAGAAATFRYWIDWVKGLFTFSKKSKKTEEEQRK